MKKEKSKKMIILAGIVIFMLISMAIGSFRAFRNSVMVDCYNELYNDYHSKGYSITLDKDNHCVRACSSDFTHAIILDCSNPIIIDHCEMHNF